VVVSAVERLVLTPVQVVLGRNFYNVLAIISNVLTPYMLNPTAWDWGNFAG
jgi:SP family general alpha glucoside:H+ symporter-like MFS transporter